QDFGVRLRSEAVTLRFQLAPQRAVVIDLAVERDGETPVRRGHRLGAGIREIDDREAAVREPDPSIRRQPRARAVWTALDHCFANPQQLLAIYGGRRVSVREDSCYSAHVADEGFRSATRWACIEAAATLFTRAFPGARR